jgi:hypothetical protein
MNPMPSVSSVPAASAVSLSTGNPGNVTSLTLSAGTYLVWGAIDATLTGATLTALTAALSLTSAALSSQTGSSNVGGSRLFPESIAQAAKNLVTATGTETLEVGPTVFTVPAPSPGAPNPAAILYLVGQATFSAGSVAAYGTLFAYQLPN